MSPDEQHPAADAAEHPLPLDWREIAIRAAFLVLALLCLFGLTGVAADKAFTPVHEGNEAYLQSSLKHASGWMAAIAAVRVGVSAVESFSIEPLGVGFEVGRVVKPINDALADIMELMTFNALLIALQLAILQVIKTISLKYVVGYGALLCAFSPARRSAIGRLGMSLMTIGLVLYIVYPSTLNMASGIFEEHQAETYVKFSEDIGVLSERSYDMYESIYETDISTSGIKALIGRFTDVAYDGIEALWRGIWNLMTSFAIMFILTPLMALGASYLFIRQAFVALEMPETVVVMDSGLIKTVQAAGRRTRMRLWPRKDKPDE